MSSRTLSRVAAAAGHHAAMQWALAFDFLCLLVVPAVIYVGRLAGYVAGSKPIASARYAALAVAYAFCARQILMSRGAVRGSGPSSDDLVAQRLGS